MAMSLGETLKLFDACWFEMEIFKNRSNSSNPSNSNQSPDEKSKESLSNPRDYVQTSHRRSMSDDLSSRTSLFSNPLSPNTVLPRSDLNNVLSDEKKIAENEKIEVSEQRFHTRRSIGSRRSMKEKKKKKNKSLSDLELEELKGFMDLGFVFTEEDRDSELTEILPGLQIFLGERNKEQEPHEDQDLDRRKARSPEISRPYLSEAWDVRYRRRRRNKKGLMMASDWRIPPLSNEMAMKDSLRWWAHTVASAVR